MIAVHGLAPVSTPGDTRPPARRPERAQENHAQPSPFRSQNGDGVRALTIARLNRMAITFSLSVGRSFDPAPLQGANAGGSVPGVETPG